MKKPQISVLLAVRDGARFLSESVEAVISQSFEEWEMIIIDDASSDETPDLIKQYVDRRIRSITLPAPSGLPAALNRGIALASGEFLARIDADDVCESRRFETQIDILRARPNLAVLGTWASVINEEGKCLGMLTPPVGVKAVERRLLWRNPMIHSSVMLRKESVDLCGGYDQECLRFQDYELWLRLAAAGEVDNLAEPLVRYRVHQSQQSQRRIAPLKGTGPIRRARISLARSNGSPTSGAEFRHLVWTGIQARNSLRKNRGRIILRNVKTSRRGAAEWPN